MEAVSLSSVTDQIATYLRQAILEGRIRPGQAVRQIEISGLLGVSQSAVREALRTLSAEGLVEIEPRKGARVAPLAADALKEIYELRALLEPPLLAESARFHDESHVPVVEGFLRQLNEAVRGEDRGAYHRLNHQFHFAIFNAAGRTWKGRILEILWSASTPYHILYDVTLDLPQMQDEHAAMFAAWRDRRADTLVALQDRHRNHTGTYFQMVSEQAWSSGDAAEDHDGRAAARQSISKSSL